MFKSLRWLIKFRKNFQNLKKHYQIIIYATKKDFAYYQKKTKFKRLSNGRSAFLYSTNARLSSKNLIYVTSSSWHH